MSCIVNLGILGVFKYYNFFIEQAVVLLQNVGFNAHVATLNIILPVGISFYTFQALSYSIDVYRRTLEPTRNFPAFFAYLSFFPLLVAGPIERATNMLPQFLKPRIFDYSLAVDGCRQILWGFFKKMVVADSCAIVSNYLVNAGADGRWVTTWVAIFCFTIQIYCDFSGYSDIAIGSSKLFGFRAMQNFNFPYFSRDIAEFWRRWHISLTTWFRDYLYIPLGGSRCGKFGKIRNTFIIFLVSGLWHGANWTFIVWGLVHAVCFLPLLLCNSNRKYLNTIADGKVLPSFGELWRMSFTFFVVMLGWAIFLAPSMSTALSWFHSMLTFSGGLTIHALSGSSLLFAVIPWIIFLFVVEWFNRNESYGCAKFPKSMILRWLCYIGLVSIIFFFNSPQADFIYFQF